ncbi:helix-turn-helix transcriptional regulator [Enterobacter ludwigii]|uniref:helix-turn-helix domain-containing protein n=1 Tax=Enterobacter ludwigii TaxID=299767 RepID=UPI00159C9F37|nr:AraC family transcriptional regulator [Enterobacter ludwigii]QLA06968.1 helix-turn-helix transcriptional regulator [Enterobacter ludwigii]
MSAEINGLHSGTMYNISRAIHELLDWIEMNIHQSLSVKDVVRRSGYSTFYLQHMFTSVTGEPIARYIRRRKLGAASRLLRENDAGISDIAFGLGFEDISTFYRCFRREFGLSPGEYSKRWKKPSELIIFRKNEASSV